MRLISVNISPPGEITINGEKERTGFFKRPVEGPVCVLDNRLDGDFIATQYDWGGPTQAVFAYQQENYEFWRARIAPENGYGPGFFGENFTVAGMPDEEVRVGDVYRFGGAVFQVTKPRTPCRKLGARVGDRSFIKEYLHSLRLGFYMRVLEKGVVEAGDSIELVRADPAGVSVAAYAAMMDIDRGPAELLERALTIDNLEAAHRERIKRLLEVHAQA